MNSVIACRPQDSAFDRYADPMFALRYRVFHERLQWDVKPVDGREIDRFDTPRAVYLLSRDSDDHVAGGWRLLPSTEPYMLRDVFPELLYDRPAPREKGVWEISRFAFDRAALGDGAFGFGRAARELLAETTRFAFANGIYRFVLVVSTAIERLLRNTGIRLHRYGPPMRIGSVMTVACWVDMDAHTRRALLSEAEQPQYLEAA